MNKLAPAIVAMLMINAAAGSARAANSIPLRPVAQQQTYDQFIVRYRAGSLERADPTRIEAALLGAAKHLPGAPQLRHVRRLGVHSDVVKSSLPLGEAEAERFMQAVARDPSVEYIELDQKLPRRQTQSVSNDLTTLDQLHAQAPWGGSYINDPLYPRQWNLFDSLSGIDAPREWHAPDGGGPGMVAAVLDSGITPHPDLDAKVLPGYDFISDLDASLDGDGRDDNPLDEGDGPGMISSWHGTHVAGIIGAAANNGIGVVGVAPGVKILPVRVIGWYGTWSDVADAIVWSSGADVPGVPSNQHPAIVLNMSLGQDDLVCPLTLQYAINEAVSRGASVVVAASNYSDPDLSTPENCDNVIVVGGSDSNGNSAPSWPAGGTVVDVSAPNYVWSTINDGRVELGSPGYSLMGGNSMSAPHVAGVIALMQSAARWTPVEVEDILKRTARPFSGSSTIANGSGIVNARYAMDVGQEQCKSCTETNAE